MINAIEWFQSHGFTSDDKITVKDVLELQADAQAELKQTIYATWLILKPLERQTTPNLMAIREAIFILQFQEMNKSAELLKDKKRMDWLFKNSCIIVNEMCLTSRESLDSAADYDRT